MDECVARILIEIYSKLLWHTHTHLADAIAADFVKMAHCVLVFTVHAPWA